MHIYIYIMFIALPMGFTQHPVLQLWWLLGVIKITWTQELSWDDPTWPYLGREQTMIQMRSSHLLGSPTPSPVISSHIMSKKSPIVRLFPHWIHQPGCPHLQGICVRHRSRWEAIRPRHPKRASSRRSGSGWLGHQRMWLEATGTTEKSEMQA